MRLYQSDEIKVCKTCELIVHELAYINPAMTEEQFVAFKKDIELNGQLQPVIVYRGKIVDGRNRLRALTELRIDTIKFTELYRNLKSNDIIKVIMSTEKRRHQTATQLAIAAYNSHKSGLSKTLDEAAMKYGCSKSNLKYVRQLENLGRLDLIEVLSDGSKINISDNPKIKKPSDSLSAIISWVKSNSYICDYNDVSFDDGETKRYSTEDISKVEAISTIAKTWNEDLIKLLIYKIYN